MSNKTQISRPLKGLGNLEVANASKDKSTDSTPVIQLPRDMYLHVPTSYKAGGCPTEWWWHVGTLKSDEGRVFGFEVNAAAFYPLGFTEVMLTDVQNQKHYQQTKKGVAIPELWAESDPSKDWFVNLEDVTMTAPQADPTQNMRVKAKLVDGEKIVNFDLTLSQKGSPLIVWGTGVQPPAPPVPTLGNNNFYFSLTRLQAKGTITVETKGTDVFEKHHVSGITWMDHEWGKFSGSHGKSIKWILQDMQFSNGVCLSNYSLKEPKLNESSSGMATIQLNENEPSYYVETTLTPTKSITLEGKEYFTEISVVIPTYGISAVVKSLMPDQTFGRSVYEGVGTVTGSMKVGVKIENIQGTAWIEQTI